MARIDELLTPDEILVLAANTRLAAQDKRHVGTFGEKPVVAGSLVFWPAATVIASKTFYDKTTQGLLSDKFTGTRTWPGGFTGENVIISHIRIDPEIALAFAVAIVGETAAQAYHYFQTGTMIVAEIDGVRQFEINVKSFLPQYSIGNGAGGYSLITKDNFDLGFELPEVIKVPAGKDLKIFVNPPDGLKTAADVAATTGQYPQFSALNIYTLFLQAFGRSVAANV